MWLRIQYFPQRLSKFKLALLLKKIMPLPGQSIIIVFAQA